MFALSNGLAKFQCSISTETVDVYCLVRFSFLIDVEALYSFYIVSETPMLRNVHFDVEFFYSFHLKNLYLETRI